MYNAGLQPTSPSQVGSGGSAPRERLPNFLLSPAGLTGGPSPTGAAGSSFGAGAAPTALPSPAFNERLRPTSAHGAPSARRGHTPGAPAPASARKPPTRSLLDSGPGVVALHTPSPAAARTEGHGGLSSETPTSALGGLRTPITPGGSLSGTPPEAERWITVFGFPAAMEALVVRDLRRNGEVVRTLGGRGNWMHVMYRTKTQASVAAHRPWRLLAGGSTMIGVTSCTEPELVAAAERDSEAGAMLVASPTQSAGSAHGTPLMMTGMPASSPGHSSALRTPKSVVRAGVGSGAFGASPMGMIDPQSPRASSVMASPGQASIMRAPPPQRGLLGYLSDIMSGEAR
jgi:hypothetical protein